MMDKFLSRDMILLFTGSWQHQVNEGAGGLVTVTSPPFTCPISNRKYNYRAVEAMHNNPRVFFVKKKKNNNNI